MKSLVVAVTLFVATPALAGPILNNLDVDNGACISALPTAGAKWESTGHFQFAVFWDDNLTCEATIDHGYAPYYRYDNFDGTGGLRIEMFQADLIPCKKYQIDWRKVYDDGTYDPVEAVLINPVNNPECQGVGFSAQSGPAGGGGGSAAQQGPETPAVPEPGMVVLLASGIACLTRRRYRSRRACDIC